MSINYYGLNVLGKIFGKVGHGAVVHWSLLTLKKARSFEWVLSRVNTTTPSTEPCILIMGNLHRWHSWPQGLGKIFPPLNYTNLNFGLFWTKRTFQIFVKMH